VVLVAVSALLTVHATALGRNSASGGYCSSYPTLTQALPLSHTAVPIFIGIYSSPLFCGRAHVCLCGALCRPPSLQIRRWQQSHSSRSSACSWCIGSTCSGCGRGSASRLTLRSRYTRMHPGRSNSAGYSTHYQLLGGVCGVAHQHLPRRQSKDNSTA